MPDCVIANLIYTGRLTWYLQWWNYSLNRHMLRYYRFYRFAGDLQVPGLNAEVVATRRYTLRPKNNNSHLPGQLNSRPVTHTLSKSISWRVIFRDTSVEFSALRRFPKSCFDSVTSQDPSSPPSQPYVSVGNWPKDLHSPGLVTRWPVQLGLLCICKLQVKPRVPRKLPPIDCDCWQPVIWG